MTIPSCKKQSNTPDEPIPAVKLRHLTVTPQVAGSPRRIAAATITDEGSTLSASWTAGDWLSFCNLSRQDHSSEPPVLYTGRLEATTTAEVSSLVGGVTCTAEDYLAVVYPQNSTFEYIDASTGYRYIIPLSGQDGTLGTLATSYHHQYGRAHVTAVSETDATATMGQMKSLLTVCKFRFKNKDTDADIPVGTLTISYSTDDSSNGKYPQSASVTVTALTDNSGAHAVANNVSAALTITCPSEQNEVYAAMLPTPLSRTYNFTVTNSVGTYTGTASAQLNEGEFVVATLKLQIKSNI